MRALYYPHSDIQSEVVLKNALLLWDRIETIVPNREWTPTNPRTPVLVRKATELIVERRIPTEEEQTKAHEAMQISARSGALWALLQASPREWGRREYLIYPEEFLDRTWHLLKRGGFARSAAEASDYRVPAVVGLYMMAVLADVRAGTQLQKVTDRTEAYRWIAEHHAQLLSSQYVTNLDVSQVAPQQIV